VVVVCTVVVETVVVCCVVTSVVVCTVVVCGSDVVSAAGSLSSGLSARKRMTARRITPTATAR
jgi:hypothetical protein